MGQQRGSAQLDDTIKIVQLETVSGGGSSQHLVDTNKPLPPAWQKYDACLRPFFQQYDAYTSRGRTGAEPNWSDVPRCKAELHTDLSAPAE